MTSIIDSRETGLSDFLSAPSEDIFHKTRLFAQFLQDGRSRGYETYLRPVHTYRGARAVVGMGDASEREVVMFCSADYLGLSKHPAVIKGTMDATERYGASVTSVPLVAGSTNLHKQLEQVLARLVGADATALFPTGHAANIGVITALCSARDTIVVDKLVHASILDGIKLSGARWKSFRHSDPDDLARVLEGCRAKNGDNGILVIVEGVYGIDGDVAPMQDICKVAESYGARLMIDDAHATGVLGLNGEGCLAHNNLSSDNVIIMGSLSKALGSMGGWIAAPASVIDYLRYYASTIAFSVGLTPPSVGGAMEALRVISTDGSRLERLRQNIAYLRDGFLALGLRNPDRSGSAIISVLIGEERILRDVTRDLFNEGIWAEGLAFPAVPSGQERIRFRVSALHTRSDLDQALEVTERVLRRVGVLSTPVVLQNAPIESVKPVSQTPVQNVLPQILAQQVAQSETNYDHISKLAVQSSESRGYPLPWVHHDQYTKLLRGDGAWKQTWLEPNTWAVGKDSLLIATCTAGLVPGLNDKNPIGALGQMHWLPEHEDALCELLDHALAWLGAQGVYEVLAPFQAPLQYLGGGITPPGLHPSFPLFQPNVDPGCREHLIKRGFQECLTMPYVKAGLEQLIDACGIQTVEPSLTLRCADKTHLLQELAALLPLLNRTIGRLPYCSELTIDLFYTIAREIRELVLSDLWLIAEINGQVVGFVGAFPHVGSAITEAHGEAGTADLESISTAMDECRCGSIAWLAVDPDYAGRGIGQMLLREVSLSMRRRGFRSTWVHWELVDGSQHGLALLPEHLSFEERMDYVLYKRNA